MTRAQERTLYHLISTGVTVTGTKPLGSGALMVQVEGENAKVIETNGKVF